MLLVFVMFGVRCSKKRPPLVLPTPPPSSVTEKADHLFDTGDLAAAFIAYEEVLNNPKLKSSETDRVRYRIGLILASPQVDPYDPERALEYLRQISDPSGFQSEIGVLVALLEKLNSVEVSLETRKKELARVTKVLNEIKAVDKERSKRKKP